MIISLCQINPIIGDIEGNKKKILDGYKRGVEDNSDMVIFPELSLCGYPPGDLVEKREFTDKLAKVHLEIAKITNNLTALVFGSIIVEEEDNIGTGIFNSAIVCLNGKIEFFQYKTLLPNYDVFDEVRYFESSKENKIFRFKNKSIGISICEDIWNDDDYWKKRRYEVDPVRNLIDNGADLLINISASPYAYGRRTERYNMLQTLTKNDNIPLAYVCCTGAQTDLIFDGGSMCFNNSGEMVLMGKVRSEDYLIFDTEKNYKPFADNFEKSFEEEVLDSLIYGLKDYSTKTGFKKAILGLSGGIDSALVTYIATKSFGAENVHVLLMPSKFSSEGSIEDSKKLIKNLGISYDILSIENVYNEFLTATKTPFEGTNFDITEENLQSRIRGVLLMAYSNKFGYMVLATGNKSEMSVGYATLYGDMSGALAVIGDVYKTEVYRICNYINNKEEIIPFEIINKAPSAELRPNQKDEDSLPPYQLLDRILKMYLEEYKEYKEICSEIGNRSTVEKVLSLVDNNEFKRKQAAPVLRVSVKAFGYGRRFPIVQKWNKNRIIKETIN